MPDETSVNAGGKTEFGGRVPTEEFETFRRNFPQYGASNWFVNTALAAFNKRCEENPEIIRAVDDSIDSMLDTTLKRDKT